MARNFKTQLSRQIGESVVVVELGKRGIVSTAFAGNVPDIDLLANANDTAVPPASQSLEHWFSLF